MSSPAKRVRTDAAADATSATADLTAAASSSVLLSKSGAVAATDTSAIDESAVQQQQTTDDSNSAVAANQSIPLIAFLKSDLVDTIEPHLTLKMLCALRQCCKTLRRFGGRFVNDLTIAQAIEALTNRHPRKHKGEGRQIWPKVPVVYDEYDNEQEEEEEEEEENRLRRQAIQTLACQEISRRGFFHEHSVVRGVGYIPYEDGGNIAQLCFGMKLPYKRLVLALYLGRRWYKDKKVPSQEISEAPHKSKGGYSEFITEDDIEEFWMPSLQCENKMRVSKSGAKCIDGPWLKYFLPVALNDLFKRTIRENLNKVWGEWKEQQVFSNFQIVYTGFADHCGDDIVVGVRLGDALPAGLLDTFELCGKAFMFNSVWDIVSVSSEFVARTMEKANLGGFWPAARHSESVAMLEDTLYERVARILQGAQIDVEEEIPLGFYLVFNGNC